MVVGCALSAVCCSVCGGRRWLFLLGVCYVLSDLCCAALFVVCCLFVIACGLLRLVV